MKHHATLKRLGAVCGSLLLVFGTTWMPVAQAANIATEAAIVGATDRSVQRAELVDALVALGAERDLAVERTAILTDDEVAEVIAGIDDLPAGAGVAEIIGVVVIVLVVFELVGLTDVLPFIRPIN